MTVQVEGQSVSHSFAFNCKQLHQLCEALLQGTMGSVDHALEKAELTPDKVDQIVSFLTYNIITLTITAHRWRLH